MITQKINDRIRIETATNEIEAKENKFNQNEYTRFFVDNKPVTYHGIIQAIIEISKNQNISIIPSQEESIKLRNNVIKKLNDDMKSKIIQRREKYKQDGFNEKHLQPLSDMVEKINEYGVRVEK